MTRAGDELAALLASQPKPVCAALTPFRVLDADFEAGSVRLEFAPQPAFRNHFGNVQGGFAVALLDVVMSIAAYAKYRQWLPTAEIKTSFLDPLPVGPCRGEATVAKAGRSLAFVEGRLLAPDGRVAVAATGTAIVPSARPGA